MNQESNPGLTIAITKRLIYVAMMGLVFALLSSSVIDAFLKKWSGGAFDTKNPYRLEKTLAYETPRPYAYRVLFPWLVNGTANLLPPSLLSSPPSEILRRGAAHYLGPQEAESVPPLLQIKFIIAALWMFLFLFGTLWFYRLIVIQTLPICREHADLATILFGLFLPMSFRGGGGFIYDFSELFFSAAYIAAFTNRKFILSGIILVGAVVNKESNVLLLVYLTAYIFTHAHFLKDKLPLFLGHSIAAAIPYVVIKFATADQSGSTAEFNFPWNVEYWTQMSSFFSLMTTNLQIVLFPRPSNIAFLAVFAWLVTYRWRQKPLFVRATLVSTGLLCVGMLIVFCWHDEIRNLSLAFPAIFLAVTHSIVENYREEQSMEVR
jgi:hypothetical protein